MNKTIKKTPKLKKGAWFYKVRGSYLPATWQAWLSYIPYVGFLVWTLIWATDTSQPFSQILLILFPAWIASAVAMSWFAARKS